MEQQFGLLRGELEQQIGESLARQAMSNRGTLPPFRLPAISQSLAATLIAYIDDAADAPPRQLGQQLCQQGLSLQSLLEAQATALDLIVSAGHRDQFAAHSGNVSRFFGQVIAGFVLVETSEMARQRDEIEQALLGTVSEQRAQQEQLRSAIRELSTPIIPVHEGILVVPLVGSIDSRRASEVTERLLEAIAEHQAEIVIVDITGVPVIDTSTANHLLMTARAAGLLGSRVALVGIGAEIAQTIVHLGVDLSNLVTLANLQSGIVYALAQHGLGIQPLKGQQVP